VSFGGVRATLVGTVDKENDVAAALSGATLEVTDSEGVESGTLRPPPDPSYFSPASDAGLVSASGLCVAQMADPVPVVLLGLYSNGNDGCCYSVEPFLSPAIGHTARAGELVGLAPFDAIHAGYQLESVGDQAVIVSGENAFADECTLQVADQPWATLDQLQTQGKLVGPTGHPTGSTYVSALRSFLAAHGYCTGA
jgi:hypothetical protein